jgi:hypothetical protein
MTGRKFHLVCGTVDTSPAMNQIDDHPELWGQNPMRTGYSSSAFSATSDIWIRYRNPTELIEPKHYLEPHKAVFYPSWGILTELAPLVFILQQITGATETGGILITRKPPGSKIPEHSDKGSWHAEYMDAKVWLTLRGPEKGCVHHCGGDSQEFRTGQGWTFNNLLPHSVENNSDQEQVTLIVAMRSPEGNFMNMKED